MARSKKTRSATSSAARTTKAKAARRRVGDAEDLARFRDGVRLRAQRMPDKKREASRRACRTKRGETRRVDD